MTRSHATSPGELTTAPAVSSFHRYFPTAFVLWGCLDFVSRWFWQRRQHTVNALIVAVLAVISSYGWWEHSVGTQRDAVAAIKSAGGEAHYDWQWSNGRLLRSGARPRWPEWLVSALGPDFFGHIVAVNLNNSRVFADDALMMNVGRLHRLEHLSVGRGAVTEKGFASLRDLTRLKTLYLLDRPVSASDLAFLEKMADLEELWFPPTRFTDADAAHFAGLTKLKYLAMSGEGLTNAGLTHLASMTEMQYLSLHQTSVTSLEPIRALTRLKHLELTGSPIDDAGLQPASAFQDLEMLALDRTRITDTGLACVRGLPLLKSLDLTRTRVGDNGLRLLCALPRITDLILSETEVSDAGLASLTDQVNGSTCRILWVSGRRLTQAGLIAFTAKLTHTQVVGTRGLIPFGRSGFVNQNRNGVDEELPQP